MDSDTLLSRLVAFLVIVVVLAGCATSENVTNVAEIGRSYLPLERTIPPPDSLVHLTLADRGDSVVIRSTRSPGKMLQFWSVARSCRSPRECSGGRGAPERTEWFATLWSRELALAEAVQTDQTFPIGASGQLQGTISHDELARLEQQHERMVRFDVYLFDSRNTSTTRLDRPNIQLRLEDGQGNRYQPDSLRVGPPLVTTLQPEGYDVFFRRNTVYFDRSAFGSPLVDFDPIRLWVVRAEYQDLSYTWHINSSPPVSAR